MTKPKLSDFDFNSNDVARYELDLARGIAKSTGPEDHTRLLEAIKAIAPLYNSPQTPKGASFLNDGVGLVPVAPARAGLRILDVLDKMIGLRTNLKQATVLSYKNTIKEFSTFLKAPLIVDIGPGDVTRYQEYLSAKSNGLRTIDNKIATLRAIFNFAKKQGYYFAENPAQERTLLTKRDKVKSGYAIFTLDEIKAIYLSEFLREQKQKTPDYYWVLVIALLSGCRISEITSLTVKQIRRDDGFLTLCITDSKTLAGIREVPVPNHLLDMGLEVFLQGKNDAVFKYKAREGKGSGNAVGKMFRRNLDSVKIDNQKLVFHSLRKFANDHFQKNGVDFEPRCQFFGHEIDSVNVNYYTNKYTAKQLFDLTKNVQFGLLEILV
ncbi:MULTISPECIES: tyrosine-type recombinase/integrase [Delftia]|uniref:tyrosine-type recombinase/integrase n=1 Tax=Delftia TaxID=80865 RepID=UPI00257CF304|nr:MULTISPECIES: tyrosine-type recombinase/integrase [Delftia]